MANAKTNPLNSFVSETPSTNSVKIPEHPRLYDFIKEHGFTAGIQKYDTQVAEHHQKLEQIINERTQGKPPVSDSNT